MSSEVAIERLLRSDPQTQRETSRQAASAAGRLTERIAAEGLADVGYAPVDSPFGTLHAAVTNRGLVRLAFPEERAEEVLEHLVRRVSPRIVEAPRLLDPLKHELDEYFAGERRRFELALDWTLIGPFARRVLETTAAIPYGGYLSYAEERRGGQPARGSRGRERARGQPDPDRRPLPPRAALRRRTGRVWRRARAQAIPAGARGRPAGPLEVASQPAAP